MGNADAEVADRQQTSLKAPTTLSKFQEITLCYQSKISYLVYYYIG